MEEVATTAQDQAYYTGTTFAREWRKNTNAGYPAWVGALAFVAFLFVLACIGGIFAELASLFVSFVEEIVIWLM